MTYRAACLKAIRESRVGNWPICVVQNSPHDFLTMDEASVIATGKESHVVASYMHGLRER